VAEKGRKGTERAPQKKRDVSSATFFLVTPERKVEETASAADGKGKKKRKGGETLVGCPR